MGALAAAFVVVASMCEIAENGGAMGKSVAFGIPNRPHYRDTDDQSGSFGLMKAVATGFSTIWFSFAVPVITPTAKSDMAQPNRFAVAAECSHYFIIVIYL